MRGTNWSSCAGTTSTWPWRITQGAADRTDVGEQHRQAAELATDHRDVTGVEPALDEADRGTQAVARGRVIGDEPLGQDPLVHR